MPPSPIEPEAGALRARRSSARRRFRPRLRLAQPPRAAPSTSPNAEPRRPRTRRPSGARASDAPCISRFAASCCGSASTPTRRPRADGRTCGTGRTGSIDPRDPRAPHGANPLGCSWDAPGRASFPKRRPDGHAGLPSERLERGRGSSAAGGTQPGRARRPRRARAPGRARNGFLKPLGLLRRVQHRAARQPRRRRAPRAGRPRPPKASAVNRASKRDAVAPVGPGSPPTRPPWASPVPSRDMAASLSPLALIGSVASALRASVNPATGS